MRCLRLLVLAVCAVALAGCGDAGSSRTPSAAQDTVAAALRNKIDLISQDGCAVKDPAQVFPACSRFIAEVSAVAVAAAATASGRPHGPELKAAAADLGAAATTFKADGCVAAPGSPPPATETCALDLRRIQETLRTVRTEFAAATT